MKLKFYQYGELIGILFLLASTATQIFYLEPLKRGIEWRLAAFSQQQTGAIQVRTSYDNQLALLKLLNAPDEQITETQAQRAQMLDKFATADANIANYMLEKERVENYLQMFVIILFALGSLLAGVGRALELNAAPEHR
jgi:hypothetical protein